MILYNKLYNIDKYGHKKIQKKMKPLFQSVKQSFYGNKKYDIIRVARENLFMLKRLSEKTSFYNVEKWNQDYEASQYYKKNHCLHPPINFNKTQKYGDTKWGANRKKFYSKTHYASMGNLDSRKKGGTISLKKKKKFEEYNYRDLNLGKKNDSYSENKKENQEKIEFKKISEIENVEKEGKIDDNEKNSEKIDNGKHEENNEKQQSNEKAKEDENEKLKQNEEEKEGGNDEIKEPKKNFRDEKEGKEENGKEKEINEK